MTFNVSKFDSVDNENMLCKLCYKVGLMLMKEKIKGLIEDKI